jgi:phosphopantothenoylcysteine synthetase/decarboxylase
VLPTETGRQACGETGPGRLLDPEKILERIRAALQ